MGVLIYDENGNCQPIKKPAEKPKAKVLVFWADEDKAIAEKPKTRLKDGQTVSEYGEGQKKLEQVQIKQGELYRHKCKVANQLVDLPEDAPIDEAKRLVDEIDSIRKEYNLNAVAIRHFEKTGQWPTQPEKPEKPKISELDKAELMQRLTNLRPNISKAKRAIDKHQRNPQKLVQYQQKLAALEAEKEEIENRLRA